MNQAFVEYAAGPRVHDRPGPGAVPAGQAPGGAAGAVRAGLVLRRRDFVDLADAQRRAETWCARTAGMRVHGTIQARPAEVFAAEERPGCGRRRRRPMTCRSTRRPRCTGIITSRWPRRSTRCPGTDRRPGRGPRRPVAGAGLRPGPAGQDPPRQAAGPPVTDPADLPAERPPTRCGTSTTCSAWPPGTARPSAPSRRRCWTARCPGPGCARSTPCWAWSRSGAPTGSTPPAPAPSKHEAVNVGLIGRMLERGTETHHRRAAAAARHRGRPGPLRPRPGHFADPRPTRGVPDDRARPSPPSSRRCCAGSSSAAASTPSPNASPSPTPAGWATPSSSSSSSPTRSPAARPPRPTGGPGPPGSTRP